MPADTLTAVDLGRATLARQGLLARARPADIGDALERFGGLQAQEPKPPFAALWSRVDGFQRDQLHAALHAREAVRGTLMRTTLHTVSAADYRALRGALEPAMERGMRARTKGLDLDRVLAAARPLLEERPRTFGELRSLLAAKLPAADERALGAAVRLRLPLVMVPTDDRWGFPRDSRFALAEDWLGQPIAAADATDLVRRYLKAFGPATVADVQAWSGVKGLKEAVEALRPELASFRDERGRELLDLPDAPRPGGDVEAPPRLLPDFDSLVLAHEDRSRVIDDDHRGLVATKNLRIRATFLAGGRVRGTWSVERKGKRAKLTMVPFARLPRGAAGALREEADALLRFLEEDATSFAVELDRY